MIPYGFEALNSDTSAFKASPTAADHGCQRLILSPCKSSEETSSVADGFAFAVEVGVGELEVLAGVTPGVEVTRGVATSTGWVGVCTPWQATRDKTRKRITMSRLPEVVWA